MAHSQLEFKLPRKPSGKVALALEKLSAATGAESRAELADLGGNGE